MNKKYRWQACITYSNYGKSKEGFGAQEAFDYPYMQWQLDGYLEYARILVTFIQIT